MTQCEMIRRHLEEVGPITAAEAINQYGVYRLAARIGELCKVMSIRTRTIKSKNRFGKTVSFTEYRRTGGRKPSTQRGLF